MASSIKASTLVQLVALECMCAISVNWKRPARPGKPRQWEAIFPVTQQQLELWGWRDRFDEGCGRKRAAARSSLNRFLRKIAAALVSDATRLGWPRRFVRLPAYPELGSWSHVMSDAHDPASVRVRAFYDSFADQMKLAVDWAGDRPGSPT
jgi:hypothetical protein